MKFKYKAITIGGISQSGRIETSDRESAIEMLQKSRLVVVSISKIREMAILRNIINYIFKVSHKDIVVFSKELSILIVAGVPLVEALRIQYDQEENRYFKEVINKISNMIEDGAPLSEALSKFPDIFSQFYINVIRSGEVSGRLQESLTHLSSYIEKQYLITSKVKNAMMYPAVIMSGFALVGAGMMIFVIPQLMGMFEGSGQELPLPTKIVILASNTMRDNALLLLMGTFAFVYLLKKYLKTKKGKATADLLLLKLPPFALIFKKFYVARFTENLSLLITSGIPIINALQITGDVVGNTVYRNMIYSGVDEVKIGGSIAYAFERNEYLPGLVSKMIRVGERTGKLDLVLKDIADFYSKEVDIAIDGLTAIIEPIMIFVLGGAVAVLVASILMPIYQMTSSL